MKLFHLSDLHLGKSVHGFSMLEDQEYILKVILSIADDEAPQAVLISGDVFDRNVAPTGALRLLDDFLDGLARRNIKVFIISGNHDSADRLAFGSRLMNRSGIHISPVYDGEVSSFTLSDEYGDADIFLLPFLKPVQVRKFFPDAEINNWTDAVKTVIGTMKIDENKRNIILAHQFVTGASTCESEEIIVGGFDNVDAEAFSAFDYVALGHIHSPQRIKRETLRYSGTPLKYSFSEWKHEKSLVVVELKEKNSADFIDSVDIKKIPLIPKRDMLKIKGTYLEVTARDFYKDLNTDNYYQITLTDEDDQPNAIGKLRVIYPNLMLLNYDNKRTQTESSASGAVDANRYAPIELFDMLYEEQNGQQISEKQRDFLDDIISEIWGDNK